MEQSSGKLAHQLGEQVCLFVGTSPGKNSRQRLRAAQTINHGLQCHLPSRRHQSAFLANQRRGQPLAAGEIVKTVSPLVADPVAVDRFVLTRGLKRAILF